jgi:hypothetical protein
MNRYQKLSWLNLIVITATIIITTAAIAIEIHIRGFSTYGFWFITPLVILQFKSYLFKKPQGSDKVISDERDSLIIKRAVSIAYTTFWIVLVAASFLSFLIIGPRNSVPTITLPLMVIGGGLLMKIVCSVAILVQYAKGAADDTE